MRTRVALPALLALLVVSAGCAGVSQLNSSNEPSEAQLPPGVSQDGVENASALVDAHASTLDESGYTYRAATNHSVDGEKRDYNDSRRQTTRVEAGGLPAVATVETRFSNPNENSTAQYSYWWNNSTAYSRFSNAKTTDYAVLDQPAGVGTPYISDVFSLWELLDEGEFEVSSVDQTLDGTRITLTATGNSTRAQKAATYDATVVVDSQGRIHSATERAVYETDSRTEISRYRYELTGTGVSSVDQPAWVDEAQANTTT